MTNQYENIDWNSVQRVPSATHVHIYDQRCLENGYRFGIRHFPISNYYPSAPYDANTRLSDFRLRQSWPVMRDGVEVKPPINWNDVITWADEMDEDQRVTFPFEETGPVYTEIPDDIIISANAEHHGFTNSNAHICSPGSSFTSGTFDARNRYKLADHGFAVGYGRTWQEGFEEMIEALDYPDGGGVMINHPTWFTQYTDETILEMLDFDDRVLGIEIYNDYSATKDWFQNPNYKAPDEPEQGFSLNLWDRVLASGRRCWGSCVPDHSVCKGGDWHGRNVLLVSEFTEEACLRAYRTGSFYACLKDNGLTVTGLNVTEQDISISVSAPASFRIITDMEVSEFADVDSVNVVLAPNAKYVRAEVADKTGERLFLQPIMLA